MPLLPSGWVGLGGYRVETPQGRGGDGTVTKAEEVESLGDGAGAVGICRCGPREEVWVGFKAINPG